MAQGGGWKTQNGPGLGGREGEEGETKAWRVGCSGE